MAIDKWECDISRFEAASGKIAEETKAFSLRQLVPEELDLLITTKSDSLKTCEQVKAYVNEQVALSRDKKKVSGLVPMDVDALADKIIAVAQGERSEGTPTGWTWLEERCTRAAWQGKCRGDGHCATSGTNAYTTLTMLQKTQASWRRNHVVREQSERQRERWKIQGKRQRMEKMCSAVIVGKLVMLQPSVGKRMLQRSSTGPRRAKEKAKGSSEGAWEEPSKGFWSKSSWKREGNQSRKGTCRRMVIERGPFRWRLEQLRTAESF